MKRRKIVWSSRASRELDELMDYLEFKWSARVAKGVYEKIRNALNLASGMPYVYPKHPTLNQRYIIINGRTRVYYQFSRTRIEVLALYGTRKDDKAYE